MSAHGWQPKRLRCRGFGSQWDVFGDQIQALARRMPWMTVEGNHERDYPDSKDRYLNQYDSGEDFTSCPLYADTSAPGNCGCSDH